MANCQKFDVVFSLAWISNLCDKNEKASVYAVVLKVRDVSPTPSFNQMYISFKFFSLDDLFFWLKILAKECKTYSIECLRKDEYPATMEVLGNFQSRETFKNLFINNIAWPKENADASFLFDTFEWS